MHQPSILVKDLVVKTQDSTVLDGLSFSLEQGDYLAVTGISGSGKTVLALALSKKIHYNGTIEFRNGTNTQVTLVEQRYSFKNLSGISDFYYQQRFNSFDASDSPVVIDEILKGKKESIYKTSPYSADEILSILGISHLKNAPLIQLSSGEHKKFQLAKALLNLSSFLVLDNPFTGLDVVSVKKLGNVLNEISQKGTQIILIPGTFEIPGFITHIAHLEEKQLKYFGKKESFRNDSLNASGKKRFAFNPLLLSLSEEYLPHDQSIVEMKNVHVRYGNHTVLQNVSWQIKQGERWLLKGRNGAGKSSLLTMITGDHPQAYANEIYLFGKRRGTGESIWDIKKRTGYISPELHAYFDKNISCFDAIGSGFFDTIGLFRKLNGNQQNKVQQWIEYLQLSSVSAKPLHAVSSGSQRMILLARALIKNPPLLVLDEPCQGLDDDHTEDFNALLDTICSRSSTTLIYVSHDESKIPSCIEKVLLLAKEKTTTYLIKQQQGLAVA